MSNGGFTLWGNYGAEEYWLTPYVADFLLDAKEQGFTVPEWLLQRTLQNLEERMQEGERYVESRYEFSDTPDHLDLAARAYAAYVLSRVKRASPGTLKVMFDKDAGKAVSGLPLVHLGLALRASGDPKRGDEAIKRGLVLARDEQKYLGDYGSSLRDRAAMLYLLLRYQVGIPQQAAEITKLADLLHNRSYFSTQEQLFTLLAGLKVEEKLKAGWQAALKIGDGSVDLSGKGVHYQSLAAMDFQKGVSIATQGQEPLYVALSLDGYPDVAPAPDSDPVMIQRDWYGMDGKLLQAGTSSRAACC